MQGEELRHLISSLQQRVRDIGRPVVVNNQGTIELLNENFTISYTDFIKLDDISKSMKSYYSDNNLNVDELIELEKTEYEKIKSELYFRFHYFNSDINSRRVLWSDNCCISMIHYIVRDGVILCYVHLRSSDVVYKLFSDLYLIHEITYKLQQKLNLKNTIIHVNPHSLHEIVISQIKKGV